MMKTFFLPFFGLLLFSTPLTSQKEHLLELKSQQVKTINYPFFIDSVADYRLNRQTIGFVQKGLTNRRMEANFPEPFGTYVYQVLQKMTLHDRKLVPLIGRVKKLYISEVTNAFKEVGFAEIEIEFLSADGTRSLGTYFAEVQSGGADVTKGHSRRILKGLRMCLNQLNENWASAIESAVPVTDLAQQNKFNPEEPAKRGVYYSFSDFLAQEPDDSTLVQLKKVSFKKYDKYYVNKEVRKQLKQSFAISDGRDFYLNAAQYSYDNHFVKAQFTGEYFYFEDKISDTGAAIAFGLLGAAASNKLTGIVLHTRSGAINQMNRDFLARTLRNYPELRKMYNQSDKSLVAQKTVLKKFNEVLAAEKQK